MEKHTVKNMTLGDGRAKCIKITLEERGIKTSRKNAAKKRSMRINTIEGVGAMQTVFQNIL